MLKSRQRRISLRGVPALLSMAAAVVVLIGCGPSTRMPNLWDPGTAPSQQYEALLHDPYPLDDIGPEIEGGRPRHFRTAVPEVIRARQYKQRSTRVAPPG